MINFFSITILVLATVGITLFCILSIIERKTRIVLINKKVKLNENDIRFTFKILKHVVFHLPPIQGLVMVGVLVSSVGQIILSGYSITSIFVPVIYYGTIAYIFTLKMTATVARIKSLKADEDIKEVADTLKKIMLHHHLGLLANILLFSIEIIFIVTF